MRQMQVINNFTVNKNRINNYKCNLEGTFRRQFHEKMDDKFINLFLFFLSLLLLCLQYFTLILYYDLGMNKAQMTREIWP